jgi:hypothetical protein
MEELSKCMVRGGMFTDGWFLRDLFVYFVLAHTNAGEVAQDTTPPTAAAITAPDEPAITQTGRPWKNEDELEEELEEGADDDDIPSARAYSPIPAYFDD